MAYIHPLFRKNVDVDVYVHVFFHSQSLRRCTRVRTRNVNSQKNLDTSNALSNFIVTLGRSQFSVLKDAPSIRARHV